MGGPSMSGPGMGGGSPGMMGPGIPMPRMDAVSGGVAGTFPSDNIYVTGLPPGADERMVRYLFAPYASVTQCKVINNGGARGEKTSAFLRFMSAQQAAWVVQNMNGAIPQGLSEPIFARFADAPEPKQPSFGMLQGPAVPCQGAPSPTMGMGSGGCGSSSGGGGCGSSGGGGGGGKGCGTGVKNGGKGGGKKNSGAQAMQAPAVAAADPFSAAACGGTFGPQAGGIDMLGQLRPGGNSQRNNPAVGGRPVGIMMIVSGIEASGVLPGGARFSNTESTLYVAGLTPDTRDIHLYQLFAPFGPISAKGVRAVSNPDGTCKGFGFVNFLDPQSVQDAILAYNGAILPDGSVMKVAVKTPKTAMNPPS